MYSKLLCFDENAVIPEQLQKIYFCFMTKDGVIDIKTYVDLNEKIQST